VDDTSGNFPQPCNATKNLCEDLELVVVFSKPSTCLQNLKTLLDHLMLKRHCVKGDGSCLYHAIAHQAGLITASSSGDELVSGHLRHLAFLTMLNFPAVQLETTMPQEEWLQKQKEGVFLVSIFLVHLHRSLKCQGDFSNH